MEAARLRVVPQRTVRGARRLRAKVAEPLVRGEGSLALAGTSGGSATSGGTTSSGGTGSAPGGSTNASGGASAELAIAAALNHRREAPCKGASDNPELCGSDMTLPDHVAVIGGDPQTIYKITLHFRWSH